MKESWQQRLQRFEAPPPAEVWNRVEKSMEQDPASVAERLQAYEAAPPPALWDRIEQQLPAPVAETAPVVVLPRRRNTFYTYMAAAAVLVAVLVGSALLLNRRKPDSPIAVRTASPSEPVATPLHTAEPSVVAPADNPVAISAAETKATATGKGSTVRTPNAANPAGRPPFGQPAAADRDVYASARPGAFTAATASLDEDRYLVRSYNNGNTVRFSKKVSAVVDCAEHSTGFTQSLCKVSIGAVQEKLASAVTTDFGGLIERLQDLEKTK